MSGPHVSSSTIPQGNVKSQPNFYEQKGGDPYVNKAGFNPNTSKWVLPPPMPVATAAVAPTMQLQRQYTPVNPQTYLTGGNTSNFTDTMAPKKMKCGGSVKRKKKKIGMGIGNLNGYAV